MCCSINVYVDGCCVQRLSVGNGEGSVGALKEELSRSPTMKELEEGMMDVSDGVNGLASTLEQVSLQQKRPSDLWRTELRAAPRKGRTTA